MIILNEKKYIKDLLNDDLAMITDKPKQIIELLAIYYHQTNEKNIAEKQLRDSPDRSSRSIFLQLLIYSTQQLYCQYKIWIRETAIGFFRRKSRLYDMYLCDNMVKK